MTFQRNAARALLVGAIGALGLAGCASWHDNARTASTAEHRGPTQTVSDAAITAKVKTAMAADATVKAVNIDVDTVRGVVTLNGMVKDATERNRAIEIARNVSGVLDVRDNLKTAG